MAYRATIIIRFFLAFKNSRFCYMTRQNDFRKNDILHLIWDFNLKIDRDEEKQSK